MSDLLLYLIFNSSVCCVFLFLIFPTCFLIIDIWNDFKILDVRMFLDISFSKYKLFLWLSNSKYFKPAGCYWISINCLKFILINVFSLYTVLKYLMLHHCVCSVHVKFLQDLLVIQVILVSQCFRIMKKCLLMAISKLLMILKKNVSNNTCIINNVTASNI